MSEGKEKVSFLLDLDVKEFTEKGLHAKAVIEKLGDAESMEGLIEGLLSAAPAFAAVGVAAFAFKQAIDLTVEGEQIERVNKQFELLATNAGIAPKELEEGLAKAAKGLVDTDDLLKIANGAIVKMGGSAEKLPEIMEIARKSTAIYGGDAKTNFENISTAIANGNTRMLKQYGIIIDATKAQKDFADANGTTVDQLSEAGKRQAILNAALEKGQEAFKGVTENSQSATTILQTLKVTFSELGQTFTLAFEKTIGPGIRTFLGGVQSLATKMKLHLQAAIGDGAEAAAAKAILAGKSIDETAKKQDEATSKSIEGGKKAVQESIIDQEKKKRNEQAFVQEMDKIDKEYFNEQQKNVQSLNQVDQLVKQQALNTEKLHQANIQKIQLQTSLTASQKKKLEEIDNKRHAEAMLHQDDDAMKLRTKLLDQYAKNANTVFTGIERTFRANTLKMKAEQADMGKRGAEMWNSLSTNATSAFETMGSEMAKGKDVASATADAMKGLFLGMLADRAMAEGNVMLLSGIWPPNPVAIGGGAALLALGGALKAAAGSSSAPSTSLGSPSTQSISSGAAAPTVPISGGGYDSGGASTTATPGMEATQVAAPQKTVSVNIAGNYLETDQTKRMLMDLMRQESDATGFNYNQIGA